MNELTELVEIIQTLRGPDGCQWDKQQTLDTIKPYLLEETYEVLESIVDRDFENLKEELGDLLCQIVFLSQLAYEENQFFITEVIQGINNKLIHRHPHVFGSLKTNDVNIILKNWEKIKEKESNKKKRQSVMDGVPKTLPSLIRAYKIQEKASRVGFDWKEISGTIKKVEEEIQELKETIDNKKSIAIEKELGDLLFSIVNVARFLSIDPEFALHKAINKFLSRFQFIEKHLKKQRSTFDQSNMKELDLLWEKAKEFETPIQKRS